MLKIRDGTNKMSYFNRKYVNKNPVTLTHKKVTRTDQEKTMKQISRQNSMVYKMVILIQVT